MHLEFKVRARAVPLLPLRDARRVPLPNIHHESLFRVHHNLILRPISYDRCFVYIFVHEIKGIYTACKPAATHSLHHHKRRNQCTTQKFGVHENKDPQS